MQIECQLWLQYTKSFKSCSGSSEKSFSKIKLRLKRQIIFAMKFLFLSPSSWKHNGFKSMFRVIRHNVDFGVIYTSAYVVRIPPRAEQFCKIFIDKSNLGSRNGYGNHSSQESSLDMKSETSHSLSRLESSFVTALSTPPSDSLSPSLPLSFVTLDVSGR